MWLLVQLRDGEQGWFAVDDLWQLVAPFTVLAIAREFRARGQRPAPAASTLLGGGSPVERRRPRPTPVPLLGGNVAEVTLEVSDEELQRAVDGDSDADVQR